MACGGFLAAGSFSIGRGEKRARGSSREVEHVYKIEVRRAARGVPWLPALFPHRADLQPRHQSPLSRRSAVHAAGLRPGDLEREPRHAGDADHRAAFRVRRARRPRLRARARAHAGERAPRPARWPGACSRPPWNRRPRARRRRARRCAISTPSGNLLPGRASMPSSICPGRRSISSSFSSCIRCSARLRWRRRSRWLSWPSSANGACRARWRSRAPRRRATTPSPT